MILQHISIIGAGTMGNGIAHVFAQHGYTVSLVDVQAAQLEKAMLSITKNLDRQVAKNIISWEQKEMALANIGHQYLIYLHHQNSGCHQKAG